MIELEQKRHAQWIIAIDLEYCMKFFKPGFNAVSLEDFIKGVPAHRLIEKGVEVKTIHYQDDLASRTMLRERHRLEFDKNFLQPLNYLVLKQSLLTQKHDISGSTWDDFFSTYYRKKGVGESRLEDKMSIGWGGHTDWDMVAWDKHDAVDYLQTARNNMMLELSQECRFRFIDTDREYESNDLIDKHTTFKGFIWDPSDDVGQHHLALVWEVKVPESIAIESREDEHKLGAMCNRDELMKQKNSRADLYENWSNIVIDEICKDSWDYFGSVSEVQTHPFAKYDSNLVEPAIEWPQPQVDIQEEAVKAVDPLTELQSQLGPRMQ